MNRKPTSTTETLWILGLILVAAATRIIPHPFNFTALGAMSLFSGSRLQDSRKAYLLPFAALFMTDLILGFHASILPVYLGFGIYVWLGSRMRNRESVLKIGASAITGSILFFLLTNLPFWYVDIQLYPMTLEGVRQSYTAGLPYFANQLAADLLYAAALFGIHSWVTRKSVSLA
ncbi:MAG: hypothetical protein JNN19_11490 [Bacteroidia bacterium]|jgi:hypothetical protein|uniref:DUF6580 family putative transport protein n=1 Tax=Candidatus Pollutiaquabacter sp. TaxID=3416354 RepID=UPI001A5F2E2F|nr:hypothetical protein [Bacteroidota bacterium]MBL7949603.1 hypothetical protein [Bacteroidia bacterium]HRS37966.1 hypothetical protein [Bacteroidia bacterium]